MTPTKTISGKEIVIHAVAVAIAVDPDGPLVGALILGASGTGKSTLALSLIEQCPFHRSALVADDGVALSLEGGRLMASAPLRIAGQIEIRGYGPVAARRALGRIAPLFCIDLDRPRQRLAEPDRFAPLAGAAAIPSFPFAGDGLAGFQLRPIAASILAGVDFGWTISAMQAG